MAVNTRRIEVIDGLRGIAILLVVWFHVWQQSWRETAFTAFGHYWNLQPLPETGYLGVSLFFFISGFVIGKPFIDRRFDGRPGPSLRQFYWHRALKIVPSYWLNIAVLLLVGYFVYDSVSNAFGDLLVHALFIHNWWYASHNSINSVLWTLGVEVQFYLVAPLLLALFLRSPLIVFTAAFTLSVLYQFMSQSDDGQLFALQMDQLPGQLHLFMTGILSAYVFALVSARRPSLAKRTWLWTAVAIAGVALYWVLISNLYDRRYDRDEANLWQMYFRGALSFDFGLIAVGSLFAARWWKVIVANPLLLFLAAISYNLYLWHDAIALGSVRLKVPWWSTTSPHADRLWETSYLIIIPLASVAVATLVTYCFERPLLRRYKNVDPFALLKRAHPIPAVMPAGNPATAERPVSAESSRPAEA